jgi:hypothetical protein
LWISSVLATRSLIARPIAPVPPASPLVAPSTARSASTGLLCDHCGQDGHVEAFCYRKMKAQKAQARRSSQGTGGSERSSAGSETQELMLLCRFAASTTSGAIGSVTQPSILTCSTTVSQSSTLGPPPAPFVSRYLFLVSRFWCFLSYDSLFFSSFFFTSLPILYCSYHRWISSFYCWIGHSFL